MNPPKTKKLLFVRAIIVVLIFCIIFFAIFVNLLVPYIKKLLLEDLNYTAAAIAIYIVRVDSPALITKNYDIVDRQCQEMLRDNKVIRYIVITGKDGYSLVYTYNGMKKEKLGGVFISGPPGGGPPGGGPPGNGELPMMGKIIYSDLVQENIFHFSFPLVCPGTDWRWVHIGLSTYKFYSNINDVYSRCIFSFLLSFLALAVVSYVVVQIMKKPFDLFSGVADRVTEGDLSARVDIHTGDELEKLATSFNRTLDTLVNNQKDLLAANIFSENIIASVLDCLIVTSPDGFITRANGAAYDLVGYTEGELVGKPAMFFLSPEEQKKFFTDGEYQRLLEVGFMREKETVVVSKDGENISVGFSASAMKDNKGEFIGLVIMSRDLRPFKKLIANLEETKNNLAKSLEDLKHTQFQLVQTGKMSAVGQLAAGVAHEINNPLSGIIGNAQLLKDLLKSPELKKVSSLAKFPEMVDLILESGYRCKTIVGDLLNFSRQSTEIRLDVSLNEVIEKTLNLVGSKLAFSHIKLTKLLDPNIPLLSGSFNRLQQVFTNIILNAQRFMPGGGDLEIISRVGAGGKFVEVSIKDTGPGIPEDIKDKIFEPFFTTMTAPQGTGAGTGLGLSISYNIIKEHGGVIEVESKEGEGAKFTVKLPVR